MPSAAARRCRSSANVLLRTQDGGLRLTATNLEIGITAWVPGKIETDGALTVPARLIADIVAGLPAGERVDLEVENEHDAADPRRALPDAPARHRRRRVPGHPPGRRPARPRASARRSCAGRSSEVTFAAATDETRPILTGVLTRFAGEIADARGGRQLPHRGQDAGPALVGRGDHRSSCPARSYAELMRVLGDTDDPVDIILAQAKSQVIFRVDTTEVVSRLIDGQFPNYQSVLPTSHCDARGRRPRGAAQGGPPLGAHRLVRGERRQAALRRGRLGRASRSRPPPTSATRRARSRRAWRAMR